MIEICNKTNKKTLKSKLTCSTNYDACGFWYVL